MVDQESATYRPRRAFIEPDVEPAQPEMPADAPIASNGRPIAPPVVDEDRPKPLYRDETPTNGMVVAGARGRLPSLRSDPPTEETMRPIAFTPRRIRASTMKRPRSCPAVGRPSTARKLARRDRRLRRG